MSLPIRLLLLCLLLVALTRCVEPTEPMFQLEQPFYLVEGRIADQPGRSVLSVRASQFRELSLQFERVTDATVTAISGAGTRVPWQHDPERPGTYLPPAEFSASAGQEWFVRIDFADGTVAESSPEIVPPATQLDGLDIVLDPEGIFDDDRNRFLPAFRVLVDATDEGSRTDFYQWDFRYWESSIVCATCFQGVYRNGVCLPFSIPSGNRYDYLCLDVDSCYQVKPGGALDLANDLGFSGGRIGGREIGQIEFRDYGGLLVEAIQYGLTEEAYDYGRVTADLVNGGSGLNATIPAALTGNLRNVSGTDTDILGYVSAVSVDTLRRFIFRDESLGRPSTTAEERRFRPEPASPFSSPPQAPCAGNGRSPLKPAGWPD